MYPKNTCMFPICISIFFFHVKQVIAIQMFTSIVSMIYKLQDRL